jgi:hypothetical protein
MESKPFTGGYGNPQLLIYSRIDHAALGEKGFAIYG